MIGRILASHTDLTRSLRYVVDKEGAEILHSVGSLAGRSAQALAEAGQVLARHAATKRKKLVFHGILSLPPEETLTGRQWGQISERFMDALGYAGSPWCAVRHHDTPHSHVHIVGLRLAADGKGIDDGNEWLRSRAILDGIERDFGLRPGDPKGARRSPRSPERREAALRGLRPEELPRQQIWRVLDRVLGTKPRTLPELICGLGAEGIRVVPNVTEGRVSGLRYVHTPSGRSFTGRALGAAAQLPAFEKLGIAVGEVALLRAAAAADRVASGRSMAEDERQSVRWVAFCVRSGLGDPGAGREPS